MSDKYKCECDKCKYGEEYYNKKIEGIMQQFGWMTEFMNNSCAHPFHKNYATRGLPDKYGHLDLQICLFLPEELAHTLICNAVHLIEKGAVFIAGNEYDGIMNGYNVMFVTALECDRTVLRMIFPDKHGRYDTAPYSDQLTMLGD